MKKLFLVLMILAVSAPVYAKGVVQLFGQVNIVYDTMYGPDGLPIPGYINHDFSVDINIHDHPQSISIWATNGTQSISCKMKDSFPHFAEYLRRIKSFDSGKSLIMNKPTNGECAAWVVL